MEVLLDFFFDESYTTMNVGKLDAFLVDTVMSPWKRRDQLEPESLPDKPSLEGDQRTGEEE